MSKIADQLLAAATIDQDYKPEVKLGPTGGYIDGPARKADEPTPGFDDMLAKHDLLGRGLRIDPTKGITMSRWMQRARNPETDELEEHWLESDRFHVIPATEYGATLADYLDALKSAPPIEIRELGGRAVFVFQASDLQIGKVDGDGTDGILLAFRAALARAVARCTDAIERHGVTEIFIAFAGDCIEGWVSQKGKLAYRTDLTVVEQRAVFERLLYETIAAFAVFGLRVKVVVVNGNHDEETRALNTNPGNGWATSAADSVRNGLALNPAAYGHIEIHTPHPERGHLTIQVLDTIFTVIHGHQWKRTEGGIKWWMKQVFHGRAPAASHLLIHGHEHVFSVEATEDRVRICSPTFDGGSGYWEELHGAKSRRGGLTYVTLGRHPIEITLV